jgi:hypothetical protein
MLYDKEGPTRFVDPTTEILHEMRMDHAPRAAKLVNEGFREAMIARSRPLEDDELRRVNAMIKRFAHITHATTVGSPETLVSAREKAGASGRRRSGDKEIRERPRDAGATVGVRESAPTRADVDLQSSRDLFCPRQ